MNRSLYSSLRSGVVALTSLALASFLSPNPAQATAPLECTSSDTFPCGDFSDLTFQKVPSVYKFQARVSQAKLPIGKGVFSEVIVNVLDGSQPVCQEKFQNVEVRDSVLNLELGLNMSCELDEIIAKTTQLALQVCLGSTNSCLKPIELASVPYATKSSFSFKSIEAKKSQEAAVSHYTFRAVADRDLLTQNKIATGYFDFVSFDGKDGFLSWTPVGGQSEKNLTIGGRNKGDDSASVDLNNLMLNANTTRVKSDLSVMGTQTNQGDLNVTAGLDVAGMTTLVSTTIDGPLSVLQPSSFSKSVVITGAGGQNHQLDSTGVNVKGTLDASGPATLQSNLHVTGPLQLESGAYLADLVTMRPANENVGGAGSGVIQFIKSDTGYEIQLAPSTSNGASDAARVRVVAPLWLDQAIQVAGADESMFSSPVAFSGPVRFTGDVDFRNAIQVHEKEGTNVGGGAGSGADLGDWSFSGFNLQHTGNDLLQTTGNNANLTALGDLTVNGQASSAGLTVHSAPAYFTSSAIFEGEAIFQAQVKLSADSDPTPMVALQRKAPSELQIAPAGVESLTVEAKTTFTGSGLTTTFNGSARVENDLEIVGLLNANDKVRVGNDTDGWQVQAGASGIQYVQGGQSSNYQTVMRVNGGNTLDINPDGATTGFGDGTRIFGPLVANGASTFESGLTVRDQQANVALLTQTQARFFKPVILEDTVEVGVLLGDGSSHTALKVNEQGVTLGLQEPGTVTSINGTFQSNGAANFQMGISGSGLLDVTANVASCTNQPGLCSAGYISIGALLDGAGGLTNRCCKLELQ